MPSPGDLSGNSRLAGLGTYPVIPISTNNNLEGEKNYKDLILSDTKTTIIINSALLVATVNWQVFYRLRAKHTRTLVSFCDFLSRLKVSISNTNRQFFVIPLLPVLDMSIRKKLTCLRSHVTNFSHARCVIFPQIFEQQVGDHYYLFLLVYNYFFLPTSTEIQSFLNSQSKEDQHHTIRI